jgi:hypothetical protein
MTSVAAVATTDATLNQAMQQLGGNNNKAAPKARSSFQSLTTRPRIINIHNDSFYICDHTGTLLRKRAGFPEFNKLTGQTMLRGAFYDWETAVAYARAAYTADEINEERYNALVAGIISYLGLPGNTEFTLPTIQWRDLQLFGGAESMNQYTQSYSKTKVRVDIAFYRTPKQDEAIATAAKQAPKPEQSPSKRKFSIYMGTKKLDEQGANSLVEFIQNGADDKEKMQAWLVATVPAQNRFAVKRVPVEKEGDHQDLLAAIALGLPKQPRPAALPSAKSKGRSALLLAPRSFRLPEPDQTGTEGEEEEAVATAAEVVTKKAKAKKARTTLAVEETQAAATATPAATPKKKRSGSSAKKAAASGASVQSVDLTTKNA